MDTPHDNPSVFRPSAAKILRSAVLELERTLVPELTSERARAKAKLITYMLLLLERRELSAFDALRSVLAQERDQLKAASAVLERAELSQLSDHIAGIAQGAELQNPEPLADAHDRAAGALEDVVRTLIDETDGTERSASLLIEVLGGQLALQDRFDLNPSELGLELQSDDIPAETLQRYLRQRRGPALATEVSAIHRLIGGFSKDTFVVQLSGSEGRDEGMILRRDQPCSPIDFSVAEEFEPLRALHSIGFPVPEPLWLETDATVFGGTVMAVRKVIGSVVMDPLSNIVVPPPEARAAAEEFAHLLARFHSIEPSTVYGAAASQADAKAYVLRQVEEFELYWKSHRAGPQPILAAAFQWLRRHLPEVCPGPCLVHGDASLRNVLFDQGRLTALLDWETLHVGDPTEDLSYARMDIDKIMPWEDFLRVYYTHGGQVYREENGRYFSFWARVRNAVFSLARGFERSSIPDIRFAYTSALYHRMFLREIASFLGVTR